MKTRNERFKEILSGSMMRTLDVVYHDVHLVMNFVRLSNLPFDL